MRDEIVRAMAGDGAVKAVAVTSTRLVERARQIHKTLPTATAALGRTLSAVSMMGNMQKTENGSVTLQIKGGGPLGTILAVSDWQGNVRGYVQNPQISLMEKYRGKLDVGAAVGRDGLLTVIRDLQMEQPYIGSVELVSGEIAEDVTEYFARSEQTPTACALGVLVDTDQSVKQSGGYLIQLLPGAPEDVVRRIEEGIAKADSVTAMMERGLDAAGMIRTVLSGFEPEILETTPVEYRCYCTRDRVERALVSLGRDELEQMLREGEEVSTECQFCDTVYRFTPADLRRLLDEFQGGNFFEKSLDNGRGVGYNHNCL